MSHERIIQETKAERFKRVANRRAVSINKDLDKLHKDISLLGNCSDRRKYEFNDSEILSLFSLIDKKFNDASKLLKKTRKSFRVRK